MIRVLWVESRLQGAAAAVPHAKAVSQRRQALSWPWAVGFKRSAPCEFAGRDDSGNEPQTN